MDQDEADDELFAKINKLPEKVIKATSELRERDVQCAEMQRDLSVRICAYAKSMTKMTREQKRHHIAEIGKLYKQAEEISAKKVDISDTLYDSIDKDISELFSVKTATQSSHENEGPIPYVEMTVDENEPVYCTCKKVSSGEMVCCDNKDCEIEWFHFVCMGLTVGPSDDVKWYCAACRPAFKKVRNQWNYKTNEPPKMKKAV